MKLKLLTTLALLLMAVSGAWALTPKAGDTWDDGTKTLTVNSNPGSNDYSSNSSKTEIVNLVISASVTDIAMSAFYNCTNLTSVTFDGVSTLASIGSYAFQSTGLTSISIPASVTSLGNYAFSNCTNLTSVTFDGVSTLTSIGSGAFQSTGLTSIEIPAKVTTINFNTFYNCTNLTSVTFASGSQLTSIGYSAFYGSGLTSISIPASVTTIESSAFYNCSSLTSVTIPASVTTINSTAFGNCTNLATVIIHATTLTTYGSDAFNNNKAGRKIYVPSTAVDTYKAGWTDYTSDIVAITASGTCGNPYINNGEDMTWTLTGTSPNYTLTISGTGPMKDYEMSSDRPWYDYISFITTVNIENGVTSIGNNAYYYFENMTSITIPASVTTIGAYAFSRCSGLTSFTVPDGVTNISMWAFERCSNMVTFNIGTGLATIDNGVFRECNSLATITVAAGNTAFKAEDGVLLTNDGTELVAYPAAKTTTSYIIPDGVVTIRDYAFYQCTNLTEVTIPAGVTIIGNRAFYYCTALATVTQLPATPPALGTDAFDGIGTNVSGDKKFYFHGTAYGTTAYSAWNNMYKNTGNFSDYTTTVIGTLTLSGGATTSIPADMTCYNTGYYYQDTDITLGFETVPDGYVLDYTVKDEKGDDITNTALSGTTLTMPAGDVTVTTNIVTQDHFYSYFDASGNLLDAITFDELIFKGNFSGLVDYITLDRPITITGDNAVLNDMAFIIAADNVTLDNLTLVANSDLGNLIDIACENAVISNCNITYVATDYANAINLYPGANGVQILKNTIYFESTVADYAADDVTNAICVNSGISIFDDEDPITGLVIDGNKITAVIPAFLADIYENEYYVMGISAVNGVRINGAEDFKFTNNTLDVTTNRLDRTTPTFQAMYVASSSGLIDKNNISMIDIFTPEGKDVYLYALELINDEELTISKNNFNISTTGGKEEQGSANAIIAIGSDFSVTGNSITTVSKGPNAGIYFPSRMAPPCDAVISGNTIKVTGLATAAHNTGLVSGIEISTGCLEITDNTIYTYNIGEYAEGNYIYGISYAWDGTTPDVVITDNTVTTEGQYAISFLKVDDAVITGNNLIAHELIGDAAVSIASGSGNKVENNGPATLFAAGSTNKWMTWCGTEELMTPEDVTVYTVSGVDNNSIALTDITGTASVGTQTMKVIPAYTPVLIYRETVGNDALYSMVKAVGTAPESGYDSATGIVTSSTTGCTFYGTTKDLSNIPTANYTADRTYVLYGERFLLCKDNAGINANKCWLVLNSANGARLLSIGIGSDDDTTGIQTPPLTPPLEGRGVAGEWYSLDGRQLNGQPTRKGLYIYKGKKVVIK